LFADGETRGAQTQIGPWWAQKQDASVREGPLRDSHRLAVADRQCRFERSVKDVTVKFKEVVLRVQAPPGQSLASRPVVSLAADAVTRRLMRRQTSEWAAGLQSRNPRIPVLKGFRTLKAASSEA